jgi:hypothetical protein
MWPLNVDRFCCRDWLSPMSASTCKHAHTHTVKFDMSVVLRMAASCGITTGVELKQQ